MESLKRVRRNNMAERFKEAPILNENGSPTGRTLMSVWTGDVEGGFNIDPGIYLRNLEIISKGLYGRWIDLQGDKSDAMEQRRMWTGAKEFWEVFKAGRLLSEELNLLRTGNLKGEK